MATGSKAGLYQNAQSASYLPLTLNAFLKGTERNIFRMDSDAMHGLRYKVHSKNLCLSAYSKGTLGQKPKKI